MTNFATWIFAALMYLSPADKMALVEGDEAIRQRVARYEEMASDIEAVIEEDGALWGGEAGKKNTAALITSIAYFESGFHRKVDDGRRRGDGGRSWCLMQINLGAGKVTWGAPRMKEWTGKDLVADRRKCLAAGLHALRLSIGGCSSKKGGDVLSSYTTGKCQDGEPKARSRWKMAWKLRERVTTKVVEETVARAVVLKK